MSCALHQRSVAPAVRRSPQDFPAVTSFPVNSVLRCDAGTGSGKRQDGVKRRLPIIQLSCLALRKDDGDCNNGMTIYEYIRCRDIARVVYIVAVFPPPVQCCGTVCLNNRISPLDNLNDHLNVYVWLAAGPRRPVSER